MARTQKIAGIAAAILIAGGGTAIGVAVTSQHHAPQPARPAAGSTGNGAGSGTNSGSGGAPASAGGVILPWAGEDAKQLLAPKGPTLPRSAPTSIQIPSIGVNSRLMQLGLNSDGTMQVPPLLAKPSLAAWYKYSPTPGQVGPSVIEGHIDTYQGPSVFYRLGAVRPGAEVDVTLADKTVAVFRVSGVREYTKASFPSRTVYGPTDDAALRLITCGGDFDPATGHYLSSIVVFATLASSHSA